MDVINGDTGGEPIGWTIVAIGDDGSVLCRSPIGKRTRFQFLASEACRQHDGQREPKPATLDGFACGTCGRFCHDERMAIYCCATASLCDRCGKQTDSKHYGKCHGCRSVLDREKWESLPIKDWDGECPLVEFRGDNWFWTEDDIVEHLEEHDLKPEDLMLVGSRPVHMRQIDEDFCCDELPEDGELESIVSKELWEAICKVNELGSKEVLSYQPDHSYRVDVNTLV